MAGNRKRAQQATDPRRREINEFSLPMSSALLVVKTTASRLGLVQTCRAIDEASKVLAAEIAEALRDAGHGVDH